MKQELNHRASSYLEQFRHLQRYLIVAGIKLKPPQIYVILYVTAAALDLSLLFYIIYRLIPFHLSLGYYVILSFMMLTLGYVLIFLLVWFGFLLAIDYLKFKRRSAVEDVLPEFLRLVASNHRAGLPLDLSLWKANRPRFGILSEEINEVAKNTYATGDLIRPLEEFGTKYDSPLLRRVISNITEGIKTGADIAGLLDNISINIITIKNTRKDLASEVENYMLFITITVLVISPLMFSLTYKMSGVIESVRNSLAQSLAQGEGVVPVPIEVEIASSTRPFGYYFNIFVYMMMATNSIISVLLMSIVKYGNVRQELKRIPVYYVVGVILYIMFRTLFDHLLVV